MTAAANAGENLRLTAVEQLVLDLCDLNLRGNALEALVSLVEQKKITMQDLAPLLWFSYGTVAVLIQEMVSIYPFLNPPTLSPEASRRVCDVLILIQCMVTHPDTIVPFLNANIPLYVNPFLMTTCTESPFEHLRVASIGVMAALSKVEDPGVINYLIHAEMVPLCMRVMENGLEFSRKVATFVFQNILRYEEGMHYICRTADRCVSVCCVLRGLIETLGDQPSVRLLEYIIRCYLLLSFNERSCMLLIGYLPVSIIDGTFNNYLPDPQTREMLDQLIYNVMSCIHSMNRVNQRGMGQFFVEQYGGHLLPALQKYFQFGTEN